MQHTIKPLACMHCLQNPVMRFRRLLSLPAPAASLVALGPSRLAAMQSLQADLQEQWEEQEAGLQAHPLAMQPHPII